MKSPNTSFHPTFQTAAGLFHLSCIAFLLLLGFTSSQAQTVPRCRPAPPLPENPKPGVIGLSISRDGKTLVTAGTDGVIRIWDVASGQMQRTLTGHTNSTYKADFSPNEKLIASSSRDTTVRIWDFATGRELYKFTGFKCSVKNVAFSPDGKTLAVAGNDGMLKLWDVATGKELKSLVHSDSPDVDVSVYSVVFSRDGKKIYAGNGDGIISEWDATTGKETNIWKAHKDTVIALAFSPDYQLLASDGYNEANVKLWDVMTRRELRTFGEKKNEGLLEQSHTVAFSPNGKLIAASVVGFDEKQKAYAYVRTYVWNVGTGEKLFTFEGQKFDVGGLVFTPDNRFLMSGSADATIKIYDLKTGKEARTFTQLSLNESRVVIEAKPDPEGPTPKVNATIVLRAIFRDSGKVTDIQFIKIVPKDIPKELTEDLVKRCIEAARQIKFKPATRDGRPVSMYVQLEYNFSLTNDRQ